MLQQHQQQQQQETKTPSPRASQSGGSTLTGLSSIKNQQYSPTATQSGGSIASQPAGGSIATQPGGSIASQPGGSTTTGGDLGSQKISDIKQPRLYVRWEVTDDTLRSAFGQFGKVSDARVVRGQRLRSFGFVTFENEGEASKALNSMNGKEMMTGPLQVEFSSSAVRPAVGGDATQGPGQNSNINQSPPRNQRMQNVGAGGGGSITGGVSGGGGIGGGNRNRRRTRRRARGRGSPSADGAVPPRVNADLNDPNYGKQVILNPNPIANPIPKDAQLTLLEAGLRLYRSGRREPHEGRVIASLVLNVEPGKGPFLCDFRLGPFDLKLLSVRVQCRPNDVRVFARVSYPLLDRSREVYFRTVNGETRHKFFELRQPNKQVSADEDTQTHFVTIDSIILDLSTGLWKKLVLSLAAVTLPRVLPPAGQGSPSN